MDTPERIDVDTLVIGGGQAGLAVGYHLARRDVPFLIVDASDRTGDSWRNRWDSLRLFTPNFADGLPGMPYPETGWGFPTKDEIADYLESYAQRFDLPVRHGVRVDRLGRDADRLSASAEGLEVSARNVVVAMSSWQQPKVPDFASQLDPDIVQLNSAQYRNPGQLNDGPVLVVGAGNSGAEIAKELAATHRVSLSGTPPGVMPFRPDTWVGRIVMPFMGKVVLHRLLSLATPIGRKARTKFLNRGEGLMRVKPKDLVALGVERVGRTVGVEGGQPLLDDGRALGVDNVIWCIGFEPGFSWIDLPVFEGGRVTHERGIVPSQPGLYFIGLKYLYAPTSSTLLGVGRDADHVVDHIVNREPERVASLAG
jgi:putative flavoprotein involved in K+ transport